MHVISQVTTGQTEASPGRPLPRVHTGRWLHQRPASLGSGAGVSEYAEAGPHTGTDRVLSGSHQGDNEDSGNKDQSGKTLTLIL